MKPSQPLEKRCVSRRFVAGAAVGSTVAAQLPSRLSASWDGEPGSALRARRSQARVGGEVEHLVGEGEVADDGVVEALGAGPVGADVVRGPAGAEVLAAGREFADEV